MGQIGQILDDRLVEPDKILSLDRFLETFARDLPVQDLGHVINHQQVALNRLGMPVRGDKAILVSPSRFFFL